MLLASATSLLAIIAAAHPSEAGRSVAITFDDLPAAGAMNPDEDRALTTVDVRSINQSILATLRAHRVPATGFVNERGIAAYADAAERREILGQWIAAGMDLGNHTYSHADYNGLSIEQFRTEVERGEASIAPLLRKAGKKLSYFRFPMNHTGDTAAKREAAARYLAGRGYQIATCTIDTEDFAFERAYRVMLSKGNTGSAQALREEYLRYTAAEIDYYAGLHRQLFGRETAHVLILHVNRINAEVLDAVLRLFEERGYRFVTLAEAQGDTAFHSADTLVTKFGPMWGYRWARALGAKIDGSKESEPPEWILRYGMESPAR